MSDEIDEVVTIAVMSNGDESIRTTTNEYEQSDTCWPHLVEVFLEQLQGLGYKFAATPEEMVSGLEEFNQDCLCAECDGCNEEKPVVEDKKYPYTGKFENENGKTVVTFTAPSTGFLVFTTIKDDSYPAIGGTGYSWAEGLFKRIDL